MVVYNRFKYNEIELVGMGVLVVKEFAMKIKKQPDLSVIGGTIRSVAAAHSSRLFKSERNSEERSAVVYMVIRSEIALALYDQGVGLVQIMRDINPTDDVLDVMLKDGYKLSKAQLEG